jgi:peroxiredoxin family protein
MRGAVSASAPPSPPSPPADPRGKVVVFLHSGDYDRVHQGLSIAAAAVAAGRSAELYLFWWALERFVKDALDEPDFGPEREAVADRLEARRMPTCRELLAHVRESGRASVHACTGSLAALGADPQRPLPGVDGWVGWSAILQRTAGVVDRFYL